MTDKDTIPTELMKTGKLDHIVNNESCIPQKASSGSYSPPSSSTSSGSPDYTGLNDFE